MPQPQGPGTNTRACGPRQNIPQQAIDRDNANQGRLHTHCARPDCPVALQHICKVTPDSVRYCSSDRETI